MTLKESMQRMPAEIAQVKRLPRSTKAWTKNQRKDGVLYLDNPVSKVVGVGTVAQNKLKARDICSIADLLGLNNYY